MEPQTPKNARNANAHQLRPVKAIGGQGAARVEPDAAGSLALELERDGQVVWIGLHAGAALKLAEQLVATARRSLLPERAPAQGA